MKLQNTTRYWKRVKKDKAELFNDTNLHRTRNLFEIYFRKRIDFGPLLHQSSAAELLGDAVPNSRCDPFRKRPPSPKFPKPPDASSSTALQFRPAFTGIWSGVPVNFSISVPHKTIRRYTANENGTTIGQCEQKNRPTSRRLNQSRIHKVLVVRVVPVTVWRMGTGKALIIFWCPT